MRPGRTLAPALGLLAVLCATAAAQQGDRPGEPQPDPPAHWEIPDAPVLAPSEAAASLTVAPGFRVELVAAEPLVEDPVAMTFDEDGRLWVVEMRGYMPDVEGRGEGEGVGCVAVLEDADGDGRMDRRTAFADDLVMPRALALVRDGVLVLEPPTIYLWADPDGDLFPDDVSIVTSGFGGLFNPEHAANGLLRGLDNWLHLANHPGRLRRFGDGFRHEPTPGSGQWGITQDDWGRLLFNTNSDQLRGALLPPHYASRNPHVVRVRGVDVRVARDQTVWPARITPGVNRGYREGVLRPDGTLARFTAACSPHVYRGHAFPADHRGNAFVCEPAGNLVKRNLLTARDGRLSARPARRGAEFLASTDERFRPVALCTGPGGALYVADMYRGVVQHRTYVTSYLRRQIERRGLERPLGLGRIWRVVPRGWRHAPPERLSRATDARLVALLAHPNGWTRDTAQRLLVERGGRDAVPALERLAAGGRPLPRLHALWTLEGLGVLDAAVVVGALRDPHPGLRVAGLRLAERLPGSGPVRAAVADLVDAREPAVRRQLLLTLGGLGGDDAEALMARVLACDASSGIERDCAVSGLHRREWAFAARLVRDPAFGQERRGRRALLESLAACTARAEEPEAVERVLRLAAGVPAAQAWQAAGLLRGLASTRPEPPARQRPLRLARDPGVFGELLRHGDPGVDAPARRLDAFLTWPGRPGWEELRLRPLSPGERARFERGRDLYLVTCGGCHQASGRGRGGLAPPLSGSEWVVGPPGRLVRIVLHGLTGPVSVSGTTYDMQMPPFQSLADDEIAAILTYLRRAWHHEAEPLTEGAVASVRAEAAGRTEPWTADELDEGE